MFGSRGWSLLIGKGERKMKIKLHEVELDARDPEASKRFYHETLGLPINLDENGLKCFDSGYSGLDIGASIHFPGKVSISFLVEDIDAYVKHLRARGVKVDDPADSHLGMRAFTLQDPDGHRVEIQAPTDASPDWLKGMLK
jgi:catechol 2,3-dioxygenase-like lactoylglutathione lyase family enzyme